MVARILLAAVAVVTFCTGASADKVAMQIYAVGSYGVDLYELVFSSVMFQKFSGCVCEGKYTNCTMKYDNASLPYSKVLNVSPSGTWSDAGSSCKYYKCRVEKSQDSVICEQKNPPNNLCWNDANQISCRATCVTFLFSVAREGLHTDNTSLYPSIQKCDSDCLCPAKASTATMITSEIIIKNNTQISTASPNSNTTRTAPTTTNEIIIKTNTQISTASPNSNVSYDPTSWPTSQLTPHAKDTIQQHSLNSDDKSIIIAPVVSIIAVTVICIAVFICVRKRRKHLTKGANCKNSNINNNVTKQTFSSVTFTLDPQSTKATSTNLAQTLVPGSISNVSEYVEIGQAVLPSNGINNSTSSATNTQRENARFTGTNNRNIENAHLMNDKYRLSPVHEGEYYNTKKPAAEYENYNNKVLQDYSNTIVNDPGDLPDTIAGAWSASANIVSHNIDNSYIHITDDSYNSYNHITDTSHNSHFYEQITINAENVGSDVTMKQNVNSSEKVYDESDNDKEANASKYEEIGAKNIRSEFPYYNSF